MQNAVQVFKGSINSIQEQINTWAQVNNILILNTSMCYDGGINTGNVFVLVVYKMATA